MCSYFQTVQNIKLLKLFFTIYKKTALNVFFILITKNIPKNLHSERKIDILDQPQHKMEQYKVNSPSASFGGNIIKIDLLLVDIWYPILVSLRALCVLFEPYMSLGYDKISTKNDCGYQNPNQNWICIRNYINRNDKELSKTAKQKHRGTTIPATKAGKIYKTQPKTKKNKIMYSCFFHVRKASNFSFEGYSIPLFPGYCSSKNP